MPWEAAGDGPGACLSQLLRQETWVGISALAQQSAAKCSDVENETAGMQALAKQITLTITK